MCSASGATRSAGTHLEALDAVAGTLQVRGEIMKLSAEIDDFDRKMETSTSDLKDAKAEYDASASDGAVIAKELAELCRNSGSLSSLVTECKLSTL